MKDKRIWIILGWILTSQSAAWTVMNEEVQTPPANNSILSFQSEMREESRGGTLSVTATKSEKRGELQTKKELMDTLRELSMAPKPIKEQKEETEKPLKKLDLGIEKNPDQKTLSMNVVDSYANMFEKKAIQMSDEEQAMMDYSQALEYINDGNESKAENLLSNAVLRYSLHVPSRIELARIYLKAQRDTEAEQLVLGGLKHHENHVELLKLMALIMERRSKYDVALEYMNKIPPDKKNDKNTVILLGHIYQRTGNYAQAKEQYHRLLNFEPNNPLWLLGMTMALDGLENWSEALEGYKKLQANPTLEYSLLKYIDERIGILKG